MYEQFPDSIKDEKDLDIYENILKSDGVYSELDYKGYLLKCKGRYVKAETSICGRIVSRCGILADIGEDYIILKAVQNKNCTAIKLNDIKYITFLKNK